MLHYRLDDLQLEERFSFPGAKPPADRNARSFDACCRLLHIVAGISYYKAALPKKITFDSYTIGQEEADFYQLLYKQGLGEFAYRNNLSLDHIEFPYEKDDQLRHDESPALEEGVAVPIGGGKDSLVTATLLKESGQAFKTFVLGDFPIIDRVTACISDMNIKVERALSPQLFEINRLGAYNGHVPISAIIASVLSVSSFLYGFDTAILSNERSADAENLNVNGVSINHQFSKSFEFEQAFREHISKISGAGFEYFSLLRPLTELAIAERFSRNKMYDDIFTSCNRMFKLKGSIEHHSIWCGECPKCLSTFLCLAPFMSPERLVSVFGKNILNEQSNTALYSELCGIAGHKPFECVIDYDEAVAALCTLAQDEKWRGTAVVRWFADQGIAQQSLSKFLNPIGQHCIPENFRTLIYAS
jgi:hypothetical protein